MSVLVKQLDNFTDAEREEFRKLHRAQQAPGYPLGCSWREAASEILALIVLLLFVFMISGGCFLLAFIG